MNINELAGIIYVTGTSGFMILGHNELAQTFAMMGIVQGVWMRK